MRENRVDHASCMMMAVRIPTPRGDVFFAVSQYGLEYKIYEKKFGRAYCNIHFKCDNETINHHIDINRTRYTKKPINDLIAQLKNLKYVISANSHKYVRTKKNEHFYIFKITDDFSLTITLYYQ